MSEETNNEGGLSGLKKTIIGTLGTIVTAGGVWLTTQLGGGHSEDKEEVKTEQVASAPAAAPVVINLQNNNTNQQKQQTNNSNSAKAAPAPAPVQQTAPAPAPAQKESW
jgi:flagellar basal body-associated protein FliL